MTVDTVIRELVSHDTSGSVVDQDIDSVRALGDFVGYLFGLLPVRKITLQPGDFLRGFCTHLFFNGLERLVDYLLGHRQNEELFNTMREEGVRGAVADTFRSSGDDCNLSLQVGGLIEVELLVFRNQGVGVTNAHVLGDGLLDCFHGFRELVFET